MVVIEMNPRVSRSSALASKATGFPIAKIAAKLAVGYTLDELPNDITKETPACFEPTLDYCVVKVPRFAFEKFQGSDTRLGVSMKSVGETMAIGRTFKEALQKAFRGLEVGVHGLDLRAEEKVDRRRLEELVARPGPERAFAVKAALKAGMSVTRAADLSAIDPWFLDNIAQIVELERDLQQAPAEQPLTTDLLRRAKEFGFSDRQIAELRANPTGEADVRRDRLARGIRPVYRLVDTCAAEFEAYTPYFYSSYARHDQSRVTDRRKVMVLGSGPNRIGQGIEFDYCCVHTVMALREMGYETIMVNSNPETVSTDYDTSDKLYFEPLTFEDVMNIFENERPLGVIVQMGGQTPLNLAVPLMKAGVPVFGTPADSIDIAEDRRRCRDLLNRLCIQQPESGTATSVEEALEAARRIGFPVMIRPSYVLGGRAMMIASNENELVPFAYAAFHASPGFPVLIDRYLERAIEVDIDLVCDATDVYIGGIMEHIEAAGIHSGDSACCTPPHTLKEPMIARLKEAAVRMALALQVKGLLNVQAAVRGDDFWILEINPRASRTVPYLSKATGVPLAKVATRVAMGQSLRDLGLVGREARPAWRAVKEAVLPFNRFPGVDPVLGPEMKSTGEVMGIDDTFEAAYWKSQIAAGQVLPVDGLVFLSAKDADKAWLTEIGGLLRKDGFRLVATEGTAAALRAAGIDTDVVHKLSDQRTPTVLDHMREGRIRMVVNTPSGPMSRVDEVKIRSEAILRGIPIVTTESGARATLSAIRHIRAHAWDVKALQDYLGPAAT
jgi:carbamoyl-phosphate synthase large subunit